MSEIKTIDLDKWRIDEFEAETCLSIGEVRHLYSLIQETDDKFTDWELMRTSGSGIGVNILARKLGTKEVYDITDYDIW